VFLAETTFDLRERREDLKRDLQQHGYTVLPAIDLPEVAAGVETLVREDLSRCRMSIHLVGRNYSMVPEGGRASLIEMQTELAIEREQEGGFTRLLWIPPDLAVEDERQRAFIERLRNDPRTQMGADLLESCICDLKTVIHDRLRRGPDSRPASVGPPVSGGEVARIYLIYDQRDAASALASEDLLFHQGFEVVRSLFDGTEAEIREYHEDSLRTCDGALIFYGSGSECWLRRKLRELQKSAGYGRTKPVAALGILLIPPRTPEKERFRTHEAAVLPQFDGFQSGPVLELFACLKHGREAHRE
jgi:hypothetical protein